MNAAHSHDAEILHTEICINAQTDPSTDKKKLLHRNQWKAYVTPDFQPMNNIVFWNSFGFFFFGFIIRYATDQIWDISATNIGLVFSSMTIGGLISTPIVGYLTDRVSKKKLVLIGSFGRGISYLVMYFGVCLENVILFSIGIFILGFAVGFFWTPINALISLKTYKTVRSTAFGQQAGAIGLGNLIGSFLTIIYFGIMLWQSIDNPWIMYLPLFIFCLLNIYAGFIFQIRVDEKYSYKNYIDQQDSDFARKISEEIFIEEQISANESDETKNGSLRKIPQGLLIGFLFLMGAFFTASINQSMAGPFLQIFLTDEFFEGEVALKIAFLVMLVYFPSEVLSQLLAPVLGRIADNVRIIPALSVISATGALITYLLINATSPILFGIILLFDTTFAWANGLVLQNLMSRISNSNRGKIFGMQRWISLMGAVIGPIAGGMVWDKWGRTAPFYVSIVVELCLIPLYYLAIKKIQPFMAEKIESEN